MKVVRLISLLLIAIIIPNRIIAQSDTLAGSSEKGELKTNAITLSLEQAKQLALQNNLKLKNASLDVKNAKWKVWETTAIGLPHASAEGAFNYTLTIPELFKQFAEMGLAQDPDYQNADEATRQRMLDDALEEMRISKSFDITATQLIFNGSYIVGLQTSKVYKSLSNYQYEVTQDELMENIVNSYFNVLIAKENIVLLKNMLANTTASVDEMKKMYMAGIIDETSYMQVAINEITLKNALSQLERQCGLAEKLLKFQIGVDLNEILLLTDNLEDLIKIYNDESIKVAEYTLENDFNYKLLKSQETLMKQNYNLNKVAFLPSLSGYYMYHKNLNEQSVDFVAQEQVGLQLSVPIFSSGERIAKLSEARIGYEQAKNNTEMTSKMLIIGFEEAKSTYLTSLEQINFNNENMKLTNKVYEQTIEKNKNGLASSSDLSQSQTQFLTAQKDYYMSIIQLVGSKLKLDKALNKL